MVIVLMLMFMMIFMMIFMMFMPPPKTKRYTQLKVDSANDSDEILQKCYLQTLHHSLGR